MTTGNINGIVDLASLPPGSKVVIVTFEREGEKTTPSRDEVPAISDVVTSKVNPKETKKFAFPEIEIDLGKLGKVFNKKTIGFTALFLGTVSVGYLYLQRPAIKSPASPKPADKSKPAKVSTKALTMNMIVSGPKVEDQKTINSYPVGQGFNAPRGNRLHAAVDFSTPIGTPVIAPGEGIVYDASGGACGIGFVYFPNVAPVGDIEKVRIGVCHLSKLSKLGKVKEGELIGLSGNTGYSTGPHIHLTTSISKDGEKFDRIHPRMGLAERMFPRPEK